MFSTLLHLLFTLHIRWKLGPLDSFPSILENGTWFIGNTLALLKDFNVTVFDSVVAFGMD